MKIFSFVGSSGSGKTRLITLLIAELKKRGHAVAVLKHCPHGFSLDPKGKDSSRFFEAGADRVALVSSDLAAFFQRDGKMADFKTLARVYFSNIDIVLVEGGRSQEEFKKIEVLGVNERSRPKTPSGELLAVIADYGVRCDQPIFRHSQVKEISRFLEGQPEEKESGVFLDIDGTPIPMNAFVRSVCSNIVSGLVKSLSGIKDDPKRITFTMIKGEKDNEGN